jgi:glyoxylase-like metal-dependent hydrolase (beta-lactamase superfamily II)
MAETLPSQPRTVAQAAVTAEGETYASPQLQYTDIAAPAPSSPVAIANRVLWCRIPLPIDLNHINVWLLDCDDGYILVDTGMNAPGCISAWESLETGVFSAKPLRGIFVTHLHPDHVGLAAWLQSRHRVPVFMSQRTCEQLQRFQGGISPADAQESEHFFRSHGIADPAPLRAVSSPDRFARLTSGMPDTQRHIVDGEILDWGGHWTALQTDGHAEGHLCLANGAERLLISGDQVLPTISPNISFTFGTTDPNPLGSYLQSLQRLRTLDTQTLVLPSHGLPFIGLQRRADDLLRHHAKTLEKVFTACATPKSAVEVFPVMYRRQLSGIHLFLALGEALAHLEYLVHEGRLRRTTHSDGVVRYAA